MSKCGNYPIVFGAKSVADKCLIAFSRDGIHGIAICHLKDEAKIDFGSQNIEDKDILGVRQELWFANHKSLHAFIDVLTVLDKAFDEEEANADD